MQTRCRFGSKWQLQHCHLESLVLPVQSSNYGICAILLNADAVKVPWSYLYYVPVN